MRAALYFAQDLLNRPSPLDAAAGISRERMRQYLLLALLLHIWLVLMFGTAPGGAARPGEGAWGRLSVLLQGPVTSGSSTSATVPDSGPPGQAPQQRFGGAVRTEESSSRQQELPGAEKTGTWRALESSNETQLPEAARVAPLNNVPQATDVPAVSTNDFEQLKPMSTARMSESTSRPELQRATPIAPNQLAPTAKPAELPSMNLPSLEGVKPMSTATMAESTGRPELQRQPSLPAPSKLAPAPASDLSKLSAPSLEGIKPMNTATLPAGSMSTSLETMPKAQELAAQKLPAAKMSEIGSAPAVDAVSPVAASPLPGSGTRPPGGAPNAGAQQGHDVATAPSAPDSKKPLNLNLPSRGPMAAGSGGSGVLAMVPKPPDTKTAMEKAIKKGEKPDCRNAYAGAGILAPAVAVIDAATGKGCTF